MKYPLKKFYLSNRMLKSDYITAFSKEIKLFVNNISLFDEKKKYLELFHYINSIIIFDLENGIEFINEDDSVKWFNFEDYKNEVIYFNDIIEIGGRIAFDIFDYNDYLYFTNGRNYGGKTLEICKSIGLDLKKLSYKLKQDLNDYTVPFGTNCLLVALIENELKEKIKQEYILDVLRNAKTHLDENSINFNDSDKEYFSDMYDIKINGKTISKCGFDLWMSGKRFYEFIKNYPGLNLNYGIEEELFNGTLSLNKLINNENAMKKWNKDFLSLLKNTFSTKKLNLRNNIAHCAGSLYNYHSPYTSFYLNSLLIAIIKGFYI